MNSSIYTEHFHPIHYINRYVAKTYILKGQLNAPKWAFDFEILLLFVVLDQVYDINITLK